MLPRIIIAATDFSAHGQAAEAAAVELAKKLDARLYLVHVWQVPRAAAEGMWIVLEEVWSQLQDADRAKLQAALDKARHELPAAEARFVVGDPRDGIVKTASELEADLIVLGTHGRTGLSRVLLGSVAEHVARHAACATWLVRGPEFIQR
jgi:nucleotide-binding universal stress UspA family protein